MDRPNGTGGVGTFHFLPSSRSNALPARHGIQNLSICPLNGLAAASDIYDPFS